MRTVTLHLEMGDKDAAALLDEATELADTDEVTRMAVHLAPSYTAYDAKVLAVGSVPS